MAPFDKPHTSSYSSLLPPLSSTVTVIHRRILDDLEILARRRSTSLKMAPIDKSYTTLYW